MLAGSAELIAEAWRFKQMLGGALRQSGVLAAACIYALDHNIGRLAEDHANARTLAQGLAERVELVAIGNEHVRAVTHLDVSHGDIEEALEAIAELLG